MLLIDRHLLLTFKWTGPSSYEVDGLTELWGRVGSSNVEDFYIAIHNKERQMASTSIPGHS